MPEVFGIWNKASERFLGGLYESSQEAMQVVLGHPTPSDLQVVKLTASN